MQLKRADLIQAAHEEGYMWNEMNLQYLTQMHVVALFLASECFPSGDGEKYTSTTTKFHRNPLIPQTSI
jgi:hypothetical protein